MFSQLEKKSLFEQSNYNPAPGYYANPGKFSEIKQAFQNSVNTNIDNFPKEKRFKSTSYQINDLGPGSYNIQSDLQKYEKLKDNKKDNKQDQQQPVFKVNAIPSIPSNNITAGYQEIGEGLLILMRGNKQTENEKLGPMAYKPNYNYVKPKVPGFVIKKEQQKKNVETNKDYPFVELIPQKDDHSRPGSQQDEGQIGRQRKESQQSKKQIIKKRSMTVHKDYPYNFNNKQNDGTNENGEDNINNTNRKPQIHINNQLKNEKKQQQGEYNLELLVLREKMMGKQEQVPPPGSYYNENLFSCFKAKQKPTEFQCFDSTVQRFEEDRNNQHNVGPGSYQPNQKEKIIVNSFGKAEKEPDFLQIKKDINLDPGHYQKTSVNDVKPIKVATDYPSVFGSGTQRFASITQFQSPPVGNYQIQNNKQQKKIVKVVKLKKTYLGPKQQNSKKNNDNDEDENSMIVYNKFKLNNKSNNQTIQQQEEFQRKNLIENFQKLKQNGSSSFASKSIRFNQQLMKDTYNEVLGPGSYSVNNEFTKETFNQSANLVPREVRQYRSKSGTNKNVGPGSYDSNINSVKTKMINNIKFL